MDMKITVEGVSEANRKLSGQLKKLGDLSERFVTKSMISVSAQTLPMIPVETSFLVNSEYRKVYKSGFGFEGEIGYGADYAADVHEAEGILAGQPRPSGKGVFWGPDGEPQFLAKGVQNFIDDELDALLKKEMGD